MKNQKGWQKPGSVYFSILIPQGIQSLLDQCFPWRLSGRNWVDVDVSELWKCEVLTVISKSNYLVLGSLKKLISNKYSSAKQICRFTYKHDSKHKNRFSVSSWLWNEEAWNKKQFWLRFKIMFPCQKATGKKKKKKRKRRYSLTTF